MTTPIQYNKEEKTFTITQNTGVTVSIALLLMLGGAVISGTTWVNTTQSRINTMAESIEENRRDISQLTEKANQDDIKFMEIQTQLKGIDATLLEIKAAVK